MLLMPSSYPPQNQKTLSSLCTPYMAFGNPASSETRQIQPDGVRWRGSDDDIGHKHHGTTDELSKYRRISQSDDTATEEDCGHNTAKRLALLLLGQQIRQK